MAFALSGGVAFARDPAMSIDIPAQPLSLALRELARQTGANVLFLSPADPSLISNAVKLRGTPEQAARKIVAGAGLDVVRDPTGAIIVRRARRQPVEPVQEPAAKPAAPARHGPPAAPPDAGSAAAPLLEEVVVTATRMVESINRVPLSLTAEPQRMLDQQGIRNFADLPGAVPAMSVAQTAPGLAFVAIRGVQNNGQGAATTGFYLDDTPITKRGAFGCGICTGNGTPVPPLFDLDRIEVLRGPQGTLFGSGSEGGTVRYITPQPSLSAYSVYARGEASTTWNADPSYEAGAAAGGPLAPGKLGARLSVFAKHTGGWLDYRDRLTNALRHTDANSGETRVLRGALLFAPTVSTRLTLAYFASSERYDSQSSAYTRSRNLPIVEPQACFSASGALLADCGGATVFRRPATTYAPNTGLGEHTSLDAFLTPSTALTHVSSLTWDQALGSASLKAITSYIDDHAKLITIDPGSQIRTRSSRATYGDFYIPRGLQVFAGAPSEFSYGRFFIDNRRVGLIQEVRVSSAAEARPLSWVAGFFYSNLRNTQRYDNAYLDLDVLAQALFGISATQRYGGASPYLIAGAPIGFDAKRQTLKDEELAFFGEANLWLTDRLKVTGGLRVSRLSFDYTELHFGPASGSNDPWSILGGVTPRTAITEQPIAPKLGLQYQYRPDAMLYAVAAKGFRAGGVNSPIPNAVCGPQLALYGLTVNDLPPTYGADTVWSYEGGAKLRLFDGRAQLNAAAYRIDWSNVQSVVTIPGTCGIPFTTNAGAARSEGFEIEVQARPARGLTVNASLAYNDARYTEDAPGLGSPGAALSLPAASKGLRFTVPPLTLQLGARYERSLGPDLRAYVRGDWWYAEAYSRTAAQVFGQGAYAPDNVYPNVSRLNLRAGVERGSFDLAVFVLNAFNSREGVVTGGRNSCPAPPAGDAACLNPAREAFGATYNPFFSVLPATTPRQVGLQLVYRQ